jgi:hypothetical protein
MEPVSVGRRWPAFIIFSRSEPLLVGACRTPSRRRPPADFPPPANRPVQRTAIRPARPRSRAAPGSTLAPVSLHLRSIPFHAQWGRGRDNLLHTEAGLAWPWPLLRTVVQKEHRSPKPARLEIVSQAEPVLCDGPLSFGIDRLVGPAISPLIILQRFENESEGIAKRVSIAPRASTALDGNTTLERALDQHTLAHAVRRDRDPEGRSLPRRRLSPCGPPARGRLVLQRCGYSSTDRSWRTRTSTNPSPDRAGPFIDTLCGGGAPGGAR